MLDSEIFSVCSHRQISQNYLPDRQMNYNGLTV